MTFKEIMTLVPTGVFLLITNQNDNYYGATVSSLICTSLNGPKPTVAITLSNNSNSLVRIEQSTRFSLNVLSECHSMIAKDYSEKSDELWKYKNMLSKGECNYIHLKNSISIICCEFKESKKINDNKIVFAEVSHYELNNSITDLSILTYHKKTYLSL
jgi:flavin reductase (DIM6/NTAB) family NADH-FMN oxidoreductase RutF